MRCLLYTVQHRQDSSTAPCITVAKFHAQLLCWLMTWPLVLQTESMCWGPGGQGLHQLVCFWMQSMSQLQGLVSFLSLLNQHHTELCIRIPVGVREHGLLNLGAAAAMNTAGCQVMTTGTLDLVACLRRSGRL